MCQHHSRPHASRTQFADVTASEAGVAWVARDDAFALCAAEAGKLDDVRVRTRTAERPTAEDRLRTSRTPSPGASPLDHSGRRIRTPPCPSDRLCARARTA